MVIRLECEADLCELMTGVSVRLFINQHNLLQVPDQAAPLIIFRPEVNNTDRFSRILRMRTALHIHTSFHHASACSHCNADHRNFSQYGINQVTEEPE